MRFPDRAARSQFRLTSVQTAKGMTSRSRDLRGRQANLIRIVSLARRLHTSEFSCSPSSRILSERGFYRIVPQLGDECRWFQSPLEAVRGDPAYANMHTTNFGGGEIRGQVRRGAGHGDD